MRRTWATVAIYTICSLGGALLGRGYYLIDPILIVDHVAFADLRHLGALLGAVAGAALAVILRHYLAWLFVGVLPHLIFGSAFIFLGYLLCAEGLALGLSTIVVLALPWFIVLFQTKKAPPPRTQPDPRWVSDVVVDRAGLGRQKTLTGMTNDDTA